MRCPSSRDGRRRPAPTHHPDPTRVRRRRDRRLGDAAIFFQTAVGCRSSDRLVPRLIDVAVPTGGRMLLYHIPQLTGAPISDESVVTCCSQATAKWSTASRTRRATRPRAGGCRRAFPAWRISWATDHYSVAEACAAGGAGSITACANVFPDLAQAARHLCRAPLRPRAGAARRGALLFEAYPLQAATKFALSVVAGLPPTAVRPPQPKLSPDQAAAFRAALLEKLPFWRQEERP